MDSSESLDSIGAALAKATGELQNVVADKVNPHFRSKYASLPAMLDEVRPTLAKHGLSIVQFPVSSDTDGRIGVETILMHTSGQYLAGRILVTPQKNDPQGAGSAITYCRRYGLAAVLGIGQDDDDGNAASHAPRASAPPPQRAAAPAPPRDPVPAQHANGVISEAQAKRMWALAAKRAEAIGDANLRGDIVRDVLGRRGIESSKDVPRAAYERICAEVEAWEIPAGAATVDEAAADEAF